jgi:BirA family transcriptional regulator, biotin operon repressor / biotin---[acetyl-CoA-carboxylase] ligase
MTGIGSTVFRFASVSSTNDVAREMAVRGAEEGVVILAYEQTAGRGSQGRSWSSPASQGLYLSVILRPDMNASQSPVLTLTSAVAVAETFRLDFNTGADIKWPNDILASSKKICGILVESAIEGGQLRHAILGIGVNLTAREFPEEIRESATSLLIESGRVVSPDEFCGPLLRRLERWYRVSTRQPGEVINRWQELSSYARGCRVQVESGGEVIDATTRGLAPSGALIIETPDGERHEVVSGEIKLRKAGSRIQDSGLRVRSAGSVFRDQDPCPETES